MSTHLIGELLMDPAIVSNFLVAGGRRESRDGLHVYWAELSRKDVEKINIGRLMTEKKVYQWEGVMRDNTINREYLMDKLVILGREFKRAAGRDPRNDELFLSWVVGLKKFEKAEWKAEKISDQVVQLQLLLFQALESQRSSAARTVPPLPTDGRVPSRYWPRDEVNRAKYQTH